jgi:hypothetical protein
MGYRAKSNRLEPERIRRRLPDSELLTTGPWIPVDGKLVNPSLGSADGGEVNNWGRT